MVWGDIDECLEIDGDFVKIECIHILPELFLDKNIGLSWYNFETYEDNTCGEIKTKRERVPFINDSYQDGDCMKNEFEFLVDENEEIGKYV